MERLRARLLLAVGNLGQELLHEASCRDGGDAGDVVHGCDLDDVVADDVEVLEATDDLEGVSGSEATRDGGAGTGGARGVEEVDVEGQEGLGVTDALDDLLDDGLHAQLVDLVGLDDRVAEVGGVGEILGTIEALADADLDGVGGVDQALLGGVIERGAVGVGLAEVLVDGVVVGIEVDEGHGAVGLSAGAQLRQGDGVVAAHGHGDDALLEDGAHAILDDLEGVLDVAGNGAHITKVDAGALIKDADV